LHQRQRSLFLRDERLTLQSNLVPLQTVHRLPEQGLTARRLTANIKLLPLDGNIDRLENLLDTVGDFGTDSVSGDEGTGELAYGGVRLLKGCGMWEY
jgi:hypothetical protein